MLRVFDCITEQHDLRLVLLAAVICQFSCYTASNLVVRSRTAGGRSGLAWLTGAAVIFGAGVWSTHFVAELAFNPGVPLGYDADLTLASIAVAMVVTWIGLFVWHCSHTALGGAIVGAAVGAMHYTGMAAL